MKGIFVSRVEPSSMILSHDDDGTPGTTHAIAKGCTVFLNGIACKLGDLKPGDEIDVAEDDDPVTEIKATRGVTVDD